MFIVLGAGGHVGSACADALLADGENVTVVFRDAEKAATWEARGATVAIVDICDVDALRRIFRSARRAFLLNPPADVSADTDVEEHRTLDCIVRALDGSGLEKVVLESTFGAQLGERCGDLSVLYDFEQALAAQPIPATIQRAAYYMSNWDQLLDDARKGELPTMYPADLKIPMVAPVDLGRAAARRLREPPSPGELCFVEGPDRYSPQDVANAFAKALGRAVHVATVPRDEWVGAYRRLGFSEAAADSYARMTAVSVDGGFAMPGDPERGETTITSYVARLVAESDPSGDSK